MTDRFDFEEMFMKCWHVTDDVDLLLQVVSELDMDAKDQDKLMNILGGIKATYNARFDYAFRAFEELIGNGAFSSSQLEKENWEETLRNWKNIRAGD